MPARQPLYDRIGATYDATRAADPDLSRHLIQLLAVKQKSRVLDLGCGTGNYTLALAKAGCRVTGLDRSPLMIGQARRKTRDLTLVCGDAAALPFSDRRFDGAICTLAIHHFVDLEAPFAEARRVIDGGRLVIFTALPEQMRHYWLAEYFPRMIEASAAQMPEWPLIELALRRAGFRTWRQVPYWMAERPKDLFLYCGKHQPALYLDPRIRANISSFAAIAEPEEVADGLLRLRQDIETGAIGQIRERYRDEAGDYLFVVAQS
jgi:ubiquinone/menaquinone biosynthesis C-methylase UbiE